MTSLVRWSFGFAALVAVSHPGPAEASSYALADCLKDSNGLCDSLAAPLNVGVTAESGFVDATLASDLAIEIESVIPAHDGSQGKTFEDIIEALKATSSDEGLRIATHVQGLEDGLKANDLCCGPAISSPEPASISLFGLMLIAAAYRLRRHLAPSADAVRLAPASQPPDSRK